MPVKRADKTPMPVREAEARAHDFKEVNSGYSELHAEFEAERCLRCQDPVCVGGCPVGSHPRIHPRSRDRRHGGRGKDLAFVESAPGDLRTRLPAGVPVRGGVQHGSAFQPGCDRAS